MQSGTAILLKYLYSYNENSVLIYSCDKCTVYLIVDAEVHSSSFIKLEFDKVQCVRSARTDCSPAIGIYPKVAGASFIVELTQSRWPIDAHKSYIYAGSSRQPHGRHYVVTNHDIFHEVLAESFEESIIHQNDKEYDSVKTLFSLA